MDSPQDDFLQVQAILQFISHLPVLTPSEVPADESCPICLTPFHTILPPSFSNDDNDHKEREEVAVSLASPSRREHGLTRLPVCGHIFCRKDLIDWIRTVHGSCPTCRNLFLDVSPLIDSDEESSDGGEYIPPAEDEDDEDDGFPDTDGVTDDGITDDGEADEGDADEVNVNMDLEIDQSDGMSDGTGTDEMESAEDWGLTDGSSYEFSDGLMEEVEEGAIADDVEARDVDHLVLSDGEVVDEEPK